MKHFVIKELKSKQLLPGIVLRSAYLEKELVSFVELAEGVTIPDHAHPHEQISLIISGQMLFRVEGEEKLVKAGEVVCVPSNAKHGVKVVGGPAVAYDCFAPVRDDYILDRT